jgi:hypothetical protein
MFRLTLTVLETVATGCSLKTPKFLTLPICRAKFSQTYEALHRMKVVNLRGATHDEFSSEDQHCCVSSKYR